MITAILGLAIVLILFTASIRIVREAERLVPFRLGRVMAAQGPGLVLVVPIIDRTIRVEVPVHFIQKRRRSPYARGETQQPQDDQLPGHPGLTVGEVSVQAAMIAVQRNPRTKRATTEDFLAALEALDAGKGRRF
ncbi:MAG: hypothetical protein ACE5KQ_04760 [Thermoplasmata archaeon]